jgi:hypothetical protein
MAGAGGAACGLALPKELLDAVDLHGVPTPSASQARGFIAEHVANGEPSGAAAQPWPRQTWPWPMVVANDLVDGVGVLTWKVRPWPVSKPPAIRAC